MTKQVVAKRSLSEGTVQLEECIWDNGVSPTKGY